MSVIKEYNLLVDKKKQIEQRLKSIEKEYISEFVKSFGLNDGDLVETPQGKIGFLSIGSFTRCDMVFYTLYDVKKDGSKSKKIIAKGYKLFDLKIVNVR
jgi:hypothetical protein